MFSRYAYESQDGIDRRSRHRYPVLAPVALTVYLEGREYTCLIEDVSLSGIRVRFEESITLASEIEAAHPATGRFRSECKWRRGNTSGLAFKDTEAAISLCVHCLKQMVPMRRPA
jgi:hypothetical protein